MTRLVRAVARLVRAGAGFVTRVGWQALAAAALAWFAAVRWGWEEFAVAATVIVIAFVVSALFTLGQLALESSVVVQQTAIVVGSDAEGHLVITNRRNRPVLNARYELPVGDGAHRARLHLKGKDTKAIEFSIPTNRRSVIAVGPLRTVQGDPIGLFRRERTWAESVDVFVHPRTIELSSLSAGQLRDLEGNPTPKISPSDLAFHTLRDYAQGDDLRHVHWKTSARYASVGAGQSARLFVRQYNDTRRAHVAIALSTDLDEFDSQDEFELAVSCAASVAVDVVEQGQEVSVVAGDTALPTVNRKELLSGFSAIAEAPGAPDGAAALRKLKGLARDASLVVLCVGSEVAAGRAKAMLSAAALEVESIVVRADIGGARRLAIIGTTQVIDVTSLGGLRVAMHAMGED